MGVVVRVPSASSSIFGLAPNLNLNLNLIPKRIKTTSSFLSTTTTTRPSLRWSCSKDDISSSFVEIIIPPSHFPFPKLTLNQQALFLFTFIASTASIAFISFVIAAVPTLRAMRRTAISLSKLADTARDEIPPTMAAIRLSTLELTDLTLQFTQFSQQVADGVNKSAQAVQAAEAGVRQIASIARNQTMSMIEERASLPNVSIQPMVAGAAKKTSRAVAQATKRLFSFISTSGAGEDVNPIDRIDD